MATGTGHWYSYAFVSMADKVLDLNTDAFKISLHTSSYVPSQAHQFRSSTTASEVANGNGYVTGGQTLTSPTMTASGGVFTFDAADPPAWTTASFTARYAVIYDNTPATDATKPLVAYIDFGSDQTCSSGSFTIAFNASGIATVTVS